MDTPALPESTTRILPHNDFPRYPINWRIGTLITIARKSDKDATTKYRSVTVEKSPRKYKCKATERKLAAIHCEKRRQATKRPCSAYQNAIKAGGKVAHQPSDTA
jgi:hypothetical protein